MNGPVRRVIQRVLSAFPSSVSQAASFELRSAIGRSRARKLRTADGKPTYINLGSGADDFEGFIGVDMFGTANYGADLRYPLLIDDNSVDGIFTEHTLEHLTYEQDRRLLDECFRIMKSGARIRVVLPDVSLFVTHYASRDRGWFATWEQHVLAPRGRKLETPMMALSFVTQEYGHLSAWDHETVAHFLTRAGFVDIERTVFRQGRDPMLLKDNESPDRTWVSLYAEARKP
jgi:predicted SAM-dependent methyltransferase